MCQFSKLLSVTSVLVCISYFQLVTSQILWHSFEDVIGAENYSFFQVTEPGTHRVEVVSLTGDADLYVSDQTRHPYYMDYELKSATCGRDSVEVPSSFQRPFSISVYGHPNYLNSTFLLNIYYLNSLESETDTYEYYVSKYDPFDLHDLEEDGDSPASQKQHGARSKRVYSKDDDDSESPWMTILIGILKIILDILF